MFNISDRASADQSYNSLDTASTALCDCQFLNYTIIRLSSWSDDCINWQSPSANDSVSMLFNLDLSILYICISYKIDHQLEL